MRSLFVLLLLANVALFGMERGWFGQPLSERGRDPARLKMEIRPDTIQVPRLPGINAAPEPAPWASVPSPQRAAPASSPARPAPPGSPSIATPASPAPAAAPESPPLPSAPVTPAYGEPAPLATENAATTGEPVAGRPFACLEWGVFGDAELGAAQDWLGQHLPGVKYSARREAGRPGWMVIVPPLGSAAAAQAAAAQLGRDGVKEYFVIQEAGPFQYGISLGVFSTEAGARKHAATVQGQGVRNVKVVPRDPQGGKNWLRLEDVSPAGRRALDDARSLFGRASMRDCR